MKSYLAVLILLLSSCASNPPQFNSNNKTMIFVEGDPYMIPYSANYRVVDSQLLDNYTTYKIPAYGCKVGDVQWINSYLYESAAGLSWEGGDREQILEYIRSGFQNNDIGCSQQMSEKEYEYQKALASKPVTNIQQNQTNSNQKSYTTCITNFGFTTCH